MIEYKDAELETFNIVSIDPGSRFCGLALIRVSMDDNSIHSTHAMTLNLDRLLSSSLTEEIISLRGARHHRLEALRENLLSLFRYMQPNVIVSESPFFNSKMPNAYGALVETMSTILGAITEFNKSKQLILVPPSCVKNAVGGGGAVKKDKIQELVVNLKDLNYVDKEELLKLDEHAIDAIAAGYGYYKSTFKAEKTCLQLIQLPDTPHI